MKRMPVPRQRPYEASGRSQQKHRTRNALIAAARALVARGITPTVDEAAAEASISRTTAYRYFPTRAALLAAAHPETTAQSLLPAHTPDDVRKRVRLVVRAFLRIVIDTEPQQRTMLRLSLGDQEQRGELPLRQGRAIGWLEDALSPVQGKLGPAAVRRLAVTIRSAIGIESFVWLVDVARYSREDAINVMRWSAMALLEAGLAEHGI